MTASAVSSAAKDSVVPFNLEDVFVFTGEEVLNRPKLTQPRPVHRTRKRKLAPVKINSISFQGYK